MLVLGGGPAGAWAALTVAEQGSKVILAEKGFLGTGGATAAGNTTMIHVAPHSTEREAAIKRRLNLACELADRRWIERVVDEGYGRLNDLAGWGYTSTLARKETRGMHKRYDYLQQDEGQRGYLTVGELDEPWTWLRPAPALPMQEAAA